MRVWSLKMALFASFIHGFPNILHYMATRQPWRYFQVIRLFHVKFLKNGRNIYCRPLIGNHTLAFDWCHSTFKGHFSLGCHFHVHFSNLWQAFASRGLPAIAELLVCILPRNAMHLSHRKYARLSVCHTRALCPHGSTYDHDILTEQTPHYSSFLAPNFVSTFQRHDRQIRCRIQVGQAKMWFSALKQLVSQKR